MAGGPVQDIGVVVACPACGESVLQKTMIPVVRAEGGHSYLCVACARAGIAGGSGAGGAPAPDPGPVVVPAE